MSEPALSLAWRDRALALPIVLRVEVLRAVPLYGFHDKEQPMLRILLSDPTKLRRCAELGRLVVTQNNIPFPDIPRF